MENPQIRVGAIGCGGHAQHSMHPCLAVLEEIEFAACCDLSHDRAEATARRFNVPKVYTDYREMIDEMELDAVVIIAPPRVHEQAGVYCLEHGLHTFIEKPPAMTVKGAQRLVDAHAQSGVKGMIGWMWRHMPVHRMAKGLTEREEFGTPVLFSGRYMAPGPGMRTDWGMDPQTEMGRFFFLDHVVHLLDCMRFLMGEVHSVNAIEVGKEFGDYLYHVNLRYVGGAIGHLELGFKAPVFEGGIYVLGDNRATVRTHNWTHLGYQGPQPWAGGGGYADFPYQGYDPGISFPSNGVSRAGYLDELRHFATSILEDGDPHPTFEDGVQNMRLVDAILESVKTEAEVVVANS